MLKSTILNKGSRWLLGLGLFALALPSMAAGLTIENASFEKDVYGDLKWPGYETIPGWTNLEGGSPGVNDASGPFLSGAVPPDGKQAAFLQHCGISQSISGFEAGKSYVLSFYEIGRDGNAPTLQVTLNDKVIMDTHDVQIAVSGQPMVQKTVIFDSPGAGAFVLAFKEIAAGDNTVNIDMVTITEAGPGSLSTNASLDFGKIPLDWPEKKDLELTNPGQTPVNVSALELSGVGKDAFSIVSPSGAFSVAAGSSQKVTVLFNPAAAGATTATLTIKNDSASTPNVAVTLTGQAMNFSKQFWNPYPCCKVQTPPTIDGTVNAKEWPAIPLTMTRDSMSMYGGTAALNGAEINSDDDCSGVFYLMWDQDYLYLAAKVKDSTLVYRADQGQALNGDDGIQLCLDYNNTGAAANADDSVTIHDVAPGQKSDNTKAAYWQHWSKSQGNEAGYPKTFPNAKFAGRTVTGGYEVELAIKWSDCGGLTPAIGKIMGYMTMLIDYASATETKYVLWWNAGNGENVIGDASKWNKLELKDYLNSPAAVGNWTLFQ